MNGAHTVLVVDDDADVRRLCARVLRTAGYRVVEAADGLEALAIVRGTGEVSVLLSDVDMPGMDGRTLANATRFARPGLPIVLMSGVMSGGPSATEFAADLPASTSSFIAKPFGPASLTVAIRALLDQVE